MRNLFSGRRRYALACLVAVGGLVTAAASCEPTKQPVKEPAPTGLSIAPTSQDFGLKGINDGPTDPVTFTVTNNGPATSGTLAVATENNNTNQFFANPDACTGTTLDAGEKCSMGVFFNPNDTGPLTTDLVAKSDVDADGQAVATLTGNGTP